MTATIITIGDELLYGQTIDTNSAWIGQQLNQIGISIRERIAVGDIENDIVSALERANQHSKFIIITGGLGPTEDDLTKEAIANFMNTQLAFNQAVYDHIIEYFKKRNRMPTEAHRLQSMMPDNVELIHNDIGTAPGMWMEHNGSHFISMPGVPSEMKYIMLNGGLSRIQSLSSQEHIIHSFIRTIGIGESLIHQKIKDITGDFPSSLSLAYLPGVSNVKLRITAKEYDNEQLERQLEKYTTPIVSKLEEWVYALVDEDIQVTLGKICRKKGIKIGTAESCTGGAIASKIVEVPGSSDYFEGAIISYSNNIKIRQLGVNPDTLARHGAVSEATVIEMARGAILRLEVDVAVAVSGIAGPSGGTPDKPVGTVWLAVAGKTHTITQKLQLNKDRKLNIEATTILALNEIRKFILGDKYDSK